MKTGRRRLGARGGLALGAVLLGCGGLGAPAAFAAGSPSPTAGTGAGLSGHIVQLTPGTSTVQVLFRASGLGADESLDPASVHVELDGSPVAAQATVVGASAAKTVMRTAVLVIDVSGSMKGAGIAGAEQAAKAFIAAVPADVRVGLVTVSTTATLTTPPTTARNVLSNAITHLQVGGNTALYDGTLLALQALGSTGSRTIVLLTDGHDEGSKATLAQVVSAVQDARGVLVDAFSFGTASAQVAPLQQLTAASGGRLLATDQADELASAFGEAAHEIASELLVSVDVPASFVGKSVTIAVSARAGSTVVRDSAFLPLPAPAPASSAAAPRGPQAVAVHVPPLSSTGALRWAELALFVGLAGILGLTAWQVSGADPRDTRVRRRLSSYTLTARGSRANQPTTTLGDGSVTRSAVRLAGRVVSQNVDARLARRLEAAGVPLKPAEWIVVQTGVACGFAVLFLLLGRGSLIAATLGLLIGVGLTIGYLVLKESRRSAAFLEQLPDTLQLIAGSLSVGHSLPHAMDAVVREELVPMSAEFNRALVDTRLGMPVEDALDGIAARTGSQDLAWVVMAIRIQHEIGGNLSEILSTVAATIRERERLRRQVRTLSAEGRLSAWILGGLPIAFATYLVLVQPRYIRPLFTDPIGLALLALMLTSLTIGIAWLVKIVRVEV